MVQQSTGHVQVKINNNNCNEKGRNTAHIICGQPVKLVRNNSFSCHEEYGLDMGSMLADLASHQSPS